VVFTQPGTRMLNPVVMSRTTTVNPLLAQLSILVRTSAGQWIGGTAGALAAALVSIPLAGAPQVTARELRRPTGWKDVDGGCTAAHEEDL
jgi:hypothetical protein